MLDFFIKLELSNWTLELHSKAEVYQSSMTGVFSYKAEDFGSRVFLVFIQ